MKIVRRLCRVLFSLTFILSGIFKLIDPVGTGLIVDEYLRFMHLSFLSGAQVWIGIAIASVEFVIGIGVVVGMKMRIVATAALCLISFFTLLTLYLAIFNPISDCGCFGEAIHLTNVQTFLKNVVLLAMAVPIFFGRNKSRKIAPDWLQWCFIGIAGASAICFAIYEKQTLPHIDFTAYNSGTDLNDVYAGNQVEFNTVFTYEKDGRQAEFDIDNLPDSTWTFVDSKTEMVGGSVRMAQIDFVPHTLEGRFLAVSVYDVEKLEEPEFRQELDKLRAKALTAGLDLALYTPQGGGEAFQSDRKSLMTLNRSNGGITYFADGVIVKKWPAHYAGKIDVAAVAAEDPDVMILNQRISEQIFVSILVAGVLVIILLVGYFCRMFIKQEKNGGKHTS